MAMLREMIVTYLWHKFIYAREVEKKNIENLRETQTGKSPIGVVLSQPAKQEYQPVV